MQMDEILKEYCEKNPIYKNLLFSSLDTPEGETIHPLLIFTQYIIDQYLATGNNRVVIILPDDECSVLPLILSKCFSRICSIQPDFRKEFESLSKGQKLRLGKAVAEFVCIDSQDRMVLKVDRKDPTTIREPIKNFHYFMEKCDGANTSLKTWVKAKQQFSTDGQGISNKDALITEIRKKRNLVTETDLLLCHKNNYHIISEELKINDEKLSDLIILAELDSSGKAGYKLLMNGRLDSTPSLAVSARLEEIYNHLANSPKESISSIYVTADRFNDLISNPDLLMEILRFDLPFIVFCSENSFEDLPILTSLDFQLWHWKPSTMNSDFFLKESNTWAKSNVFGSLAQKVNLASLATFKGIIVHDSVLRENLQTIRDLSQLVETNGADIRQIARQLWIFQKRIIQQVLISETTNAVFSEELDHIYSHWADTKAYYSGQELYSIIENVISNYRILISEQRFQKCKEFDNWLKSNKSILRNKSICIVVPDGYQFFEELQQHYRCLLSETKIKVKTVSAFYALQKNHLSYCDYLIVTWFDKNEYIRIRHSYCYSNLVFFLYDFENAWRKSLIRRIEECIPHSSIKASAEKIKIPSSAILDTSFDSADKQLDVYDATIQDYNFNNEIIRSIVSHSNKQSFPDSIECCLILLSNDKIGYFFSSHELIEVTDLADGSICSPHKVEARDLKKGDKILIRASGKDLIKERADKLISSSNGNDLRKESEIWSNLLIKYSSGITDTALCAELRDAGASCSIQQVRNWLSGETICPRDKNVLSAIADVALKNPSTMNDATVLKEKADSIYLAGKRIQVLHQQAGRMLTEELKQKSKEIMNICQTSSLSGKIEGIGDVCIYTVEEILGSETVNRAKLNKIEDIV